MKPEWRTSTVIGICERIRETEDYSALPILADALQDAGCDDDGLLEECRRSGLAAWKAQRAVAIIYSEESQRAVEWLVDFAPQVDQDYQEMMELAEAHLKFDEFVTEYDSDSWRDAFYANEDKFWDCYGLVTGRTVDADDRGCPYNCSC